MIMNEALPPYGQRSRKGLWMEHLKSPASSPLNYATNPSIPYTILLTFAPLAEGIGSKSDPNLRTPSLSTALGGELKLHEACHEKAVNLNKNGRKIVGVTTNPHVGDPYFTRTVADLHLPATGRDGGQSSASVLCLSISI